MIFPPCYWSDEELADIPSEDLWCEIADCMFFPNTQDYVQQLQNELDRRKDQDHNQYNHKEY